MKEFVCTKCNSKSVFIEKSGNNTGLYCADCGKWIKWLNKEEIRLANRQIESNTKDMECNIDVGKKMRNIDAIRQMSLEEIAPYFVKDATIEIDDPCYSSPSGKKFWTEEDAIEDCIEWLNSEYK